MYRRNDAQDTIPPEADSHISEDGSSWLWAVFAIHCASLFVVAILSIKPRKKERIFHYVFAAGLFVGIVCYFAMASGLGYSVVATQLHRGRAASYQVFFAKYIYWSASFAVVSVALGIISGVSWAVIAFNVVLCWAWVISYLCSAYTASSYKWGFYAFGTVAYILLASQTLTLPRKLPDAQRAEISRDYRLLAGWANLIWLLHPVAFALSDGGNVLGVTGMFIFTGILDVLLLPLLAMAFIQLSGKWDEDKVGLRFTQGRRHWRKPIRNVSGPMLIPGVAPAPVEGAVPLAARPIATVASAPRSFEHVEDGRIEDGREKETAAEEATQSAETPEHTTERQEQAAEEVERELDSQRS